MKLGIFDSGIGGKALAASLGLAFPEADIIVVNDHKNVPYGSKTRQQIVTLTDAAIQPLLASGCDIIVIACNSASVAALDELRQKYPEQTFIGLEPMVKPAARLTKTGIIAVCATPATLASERYQWLVETFAKDVHILKPDCSRWAHMIEHEQIDRSEIEVIVTSCCEAGADVIVLGCTHYHWIKDLVAEIAAGRATILEPSEAVARRVASIIAHSEAPLEIASVSTLPAASPL